MKRILLASCVALNCILPQLSFSKELKWSEVIPITGKGATNCGKTRISNEAWDKCEAWAKGKKGAVIKDVELYNIATETDKGTSWHPKLNCTFHANVKCGYAIETGPKLKLKGLLKPKGEAAAGCAAPPPGDNGELIIGQCADNAADKKTPPPRQAAVKKQKARTASAAPVQAKAGARRTAAKPKKKAAAIRRSGLLHIKGGGLPDCDAKQLTSAAWGKCEIWAAKKKGLPGKPVIKNVELHGFTTKPQTPAGCSYEAKVKCLYVLVKPKPGAVKAAGKSVPKKKKAAGREYVDSSGMRWSPLLTIQGAGVTNCGENRIKNEAWDKCEAWTATKRQPGVRLKPALKDVELYNIASESDKGTSWAPKQSCTFHATLKCGYKME